MPAGVVISGFYTAALIHPSFLASVSASSFPLTPLCSLTHISSLGPAAAIREMQQQSEDRLQEIPRSFVEAIEELVNLGKRADAMGHGTELPDYVSDTEYEDEEPAGEITATMKAPTPRIVDAGVHTGQAGPRQPRRHQPPGWSI